MEATSSICPTFEGGTRIGYGARALNEGGIQVKWVKLRVNCDICLSIFL